MAKVQIAFAGHNRAHDLGHHQPVEAGLDAALLLLREAGVTSARLLTGLASGADELAAAAWRRADLGPIHAVFPFLHDPEAPPIGAGALAETATWLDGARTESLGRNPHLKQTRMVVSTADLLIVVWTGERARGAGGTADAVRHALDLGLPVLWIKPADSPSLRLIRPEDLPSDFDFQEFQEGVAAGYPAHIHTATAENLREVLAVATESPESSPTPEAEPAATGPIGVFRRLDDWLHGWLWKTHGVFRRVIGGVSEPLPDGPPLPDDLAAQPGFARLSAAYSEADSIATSLAAVHRSEQILLVLAMIMAAVVGSSPAVWPELKIAAVAIELFLSLAALMVWDSAARGRQHERWGEERRRAEQIRLERAGWALGVSLLSLRRRAELGRTVDADGGILRDAGLPNGAFDQDRVARWGAWAMHELVGGQTAYHRMTSVRDRRIAHRLHNIENRAFGLLLIVLTSYLALHAALSGFDTHLPHWISGVVTMVSTIVPAVAAGIMALEAKLEFGEQSKRSSRISSNLQELARRIGPDPAFDHLQGVARTAIGLHLAETNQWGEGVGRRQLFRP